MRSGASKLPDLCVQLGQILFCPLKVGLDSGQPCLALDELSLTTASEFRELGAPEVSLLGLRSVQRPANRAGVLNLRLHFLVRADRLPFPILCAAQIYLGRVQGLLALRKNL